MPLASLTWYNGLDDDYGNATSYRNPDGEFLAIAGLTIAVDPKIIPYGSRVWIPDLASYSANGDGTFFAHDTGSDVVKRTASHKHGNDYPVIDIYSDVKTVKELDALNDKYGSTVSYTIVNPI